MNSLLGGIIRIFSLAFVFSFAVTLRAEEKALTNADVVTMLKAGVPAESVLAVVKAKPGAYDTTPQGLIDLTQAGVAKEIITAMVESGSKPVGQMSNTVPPPPFAATQPSVVLIDGDTKTELLPRASQSTRASPGFAFGFGTIKAAIPGARASTRTINRRPRIEFNGFSGIVPTDVVTLFAAQVSSDRREYPIMKTGFSASIDSDKHARKVEITELVGSRTQFGMTRYSMVPVADLAPGEYLAVISGAVYEFGVDPR